MYYKQIRWLEEAARDSQIAKLLRKRKDKHDELIYLKYHWLKMVDLHSHSYMAYRRAIEEYKEIDLELSMIDGRYKFITEHVSKGQKKSTITKAIKSMSEAQRAVLLEELKKMK